MLEVAEEIENSVRETASREGISVDELLARAFPSRRSEPQDTSPSSDDVWEWLRAQVAEAENATPEEIEIANAEYKQWQQNMDAPRRANGERLLFPDVEAP